MSEDLKLSVVCEILISNGSEFQREGAQTEKARWPYVLLKAPRGFAHSILLAERRHLVGMYILINSDRYNGAMRLIIL